MIEIKSKDNNNIKNVIKLKSSAKFRSRQGSFIAEGVRICVDAMLSSAEILGFFVTEDAARKYKEEFEKLYKYANKSYMVSENVFKLISDTQSPQGFLCVIKALDKTIQFDKIKKNGKLMALDNIQDPSNLGTILRTAEAFNISGVVLSADCCDLFSPKVVRGSMGAVFRLPFIIYDRISDFIIENKQLNSFAAVISDKAQKLTKIDFTSPCVVVIGNEGNGVRQETVEACTGELTIPMDGRAESLNASVAASIIMWEMIK